MAQIHITRDIEFDYGHRVLGHESKCSHLHGHRGKAEVMVEGPELDSVGRVIDFSVVKSLVGKWIDNHWDHNMILHEDDPLVKLAGNTVDGFTIASLPATKELCGRDPYIMSKSRNTTAEFLAMELAECGQECLPDHIQIIQVTIHETPNCRATFIPDRPYPKV